MQIKSLLLLLGFGVLFSLHAQNTDQSVISSGGDYLESTDAFIEWTLGEPLTETYSTDSAQLTQGFHQGFFQIVSVEETPGFSISMSVFPNPAKEFFNVRIDAPDYFDFQFEVFDLHGRVLRSGAFQSSTQQIPLTNLATSVYILKVYNPNYGYSKTYQIQKI